MALYAAVRIWYDGERRLRYFVAGGLLCRLDAWRASCPRCRCCALLGAALLWKCRGRRCWALCRRRCCRGRGVFGTNYIAHDSLRPPYMHRGRSDPADNWYDYTYERDGRVRDSYWNNPVGIDRGEPSRGHVRPARDGGPSRHVLADARSGC